MPKGYLKLVATQAYRFHVEGAEDVHILASKMPQLVPEQIQQDPLFGLGKRDGSIVVWPDGKEPEVEPPIAPVTHLVPSVKQEIPPAGDPVPEPGSPLAVEKAAAAAVLAEQEAADKAAAEKEASDKAAAEAAQNKSGKNGKQ